MKISTKGQYALEAVVDLALNSKDDFDSIKNISERRNISEKYLQQLFIMLKKNGIVESIRGSKGGFKLAKDTKKITVSNVIEALEGPLFPVPCLMYENNNTNCLYYDNCVTKDVWEDITKEIYSVINSVTIFDIVNSIKGGLVWSCLQKEGMDFVQL